MASENAPFWKNKYTKPVGALFVLGGVIGLTIGLIFNHDAQQDNSRYPPHAAAVCIPANSDSIDKKSCTARGCIWDDQDDSTPNCFFPLPSSHGYSFREPLTDVSPGVTRATINLKNTSARVVDNLLENLEVRVTTYSDSIVRITIRDVSKSRFEVPVPLDLPNPSVPSNPLFNVSLLDDDDNFAIKVTRLASGSKIFDTSIGGFTYADQFLQVVTKLPSTNLFGLGENTHTSFKHDLGYHTWPMFARDQAPGAVGQNLYGVHPMYMVVENDGQSHAVLWLNSNAMEAETMPTPGLTLRSIGGIVDFLYFLGPSPQEAIQQYTNVIGRPFLPPYWSLGFQLCRYGYNSLDNLKAAVNRTRRYGIPQDVQYADIDHMDRRLDFTYDKEAFTGLPEYIDELKNDGIHFIIILDPAINVEMPYDEYPIHKRAMDYDVYIKWPSENTPSDHFGVGDVMLGYVWPDKRTGFPDFFKSNTKIWWTNEIVDHYKTLKFDGLWIDMNEPVNFGTNEEKPWNWPEGWESWSLHCPNSTYDDPPYPTAATTAWGKGKRIADKTLCMIGLQGENLEMRHYDVHNLYGWSETQPTLSALQEATGKRGIVVTRSTFPTSGRWAGHWLGDNTAKWSHLHHSIIGMMEFNLFGIPYVGADICGFFGDTSEELCERWMELGAFYPYSRNHNTLGAKDQDPGMWPSVAASSRAALEVRYTLLPYLYTLHYLAFSKGDTVIRPLFFEYPMSPKALEVDDQFLWGSWFMVAPVLKEGQTSRRVYVPKGVWYDYHDGTPRNENVGGTWLVEAPRGHIPLFVRGGGILPTQRPRINTVKARKEPLGLIVAPDTSGKASGTFYWDDGEAIDPFQNDEYFTADVFYENETIIWEVTHVWDAGETSQMVISDLRVFNVLENPTQLILDGRRWTSGDWHYDANNKVLMMYDLEIPVGASFSLTWNNDIHFRIPCPISYKDWNENEAITQEICDAMNCEFEPSHEVPCSVPSLSDYGYDFRANEIVQTEDGFRIQLTKRGPSLYGSDVINVTFQAYYYSDDTLRFKFINDKESRFEVPLELNLPVEGIKDPLYEVLHPEPVQGEPFYFYVVRRDTGNILFDTRIGGLTFSDQFLSLTTLLPSKNIYGLGENNHASFRHEFNQLTWPIFARDQPPEVDTEQRNLYGAHPYYQCIENDGKSHGVLLLNSNAMDYQMLDYPAISYRTVGGILDFFMVLGPEPEAVVSQYTSLVHRPILPPYWSLGFQLCRYGYGNLTALQSAVQRTHNAGIPQDVQYGDIDYMDRRMDFTYDLNSFSGFPEYVDQLKDEGKKFIVILDPAINAEMPEGNYPVHERAVAADAYIKWASDTDPIHIQENNGGDGISNMYMYGYVWPENRTAFPSFFAKSAQDWWIQEIKGFYDTIKFDGLWIDMNEPANFGTNEETPWNWPDELDAWSLQCPKTQWDDPPYVTKAGSWSASRRMSDKTLCLSAVEARDDSALPYRHYDVHNLYGWSQTEPTYRAAQEATGKRSLVISRSTFPGSGRWAGHWLGDNRSNWPDMHRSIIGMLEFNLFGIPYVGADICGFFGDVTEDLCERWMELGAFYPFSRNHNHIDAIDQDPGVFPTAAESSRKALEIRYRLLPFLYTLFYEAHVKGSTVVRSLVHEFPTDRRTLDLDKQFLWGASLMISPVLEENKITREIYFPHDAWYDYYTGQPVHNIGDWVVVSAPHDVIPLHIRGGSIIPTQRHALNTQLSRQNSMGIIVAIGLDRSAKGHLFWDDGESIDTVKTEDYSLAEFIFQQNKLTMTSVGERTSMFAGLMLKDIEILGIEKNPNSVIFNEDVINSWTYEASTMKLHIEVDHPMEAKFEIRLDDIWFNEVAE